MSLATLPPAIRPETRLTTAVDELLEVASVELAPADALARLGTVLTETERLAVVALDGVHDMDERQLFVLDAVGSTAGWLRARRTGGSPGLRMFARRLAECPDVRAAVVAGTLSTDAAQRVCAALAEVPAEVDEACLRGVVADGARQVLTEMYGGAAEPADVAELTRLCADAVEDPVRPASARLEPVFVFLAMKIAPAVLKRTLGDLTAALLPDRYDDDLDDRYDEEYFDLEPVLDGRWHVGGYLDPETGTTLQAALRRRLATAPDDPLSPQSAGKRRAQALASLARDGVDNDGSGYERPAADISIVVHDTTITDSPGSLPARMSDGTRLRLDTVRRLGCDGRISAVVLDAYGKPVGASGRHRNATLRERRALEARWGGCAVDGCSQPFSRTRPHHVIPWWLSKITRLKDLAPACDLHHYDIHEGGRTLRLRDGSYIDPVGWADGPTS